VTENMFGDIVSELAAGICGGLGLAPSADVGLNHGVFQPCHGSAPDLVGKDEANPVGAILSAAMMLGWLGQRGADPIALGISRTIHAAVATVIKDGIRTRDVGGTAGTRAVGEAVVAALSHELHPF